MMNVPNIRIVLRRAVFGSLLLRFVFSGSGVVVPNASLPSSSSYNPFGKTHGLDYARKNKWE